MSANRATDPVAAMARGLGVSEAGYHAGRQREPSALAQADAALLKRIRTIHAGSGEAYGAPRVHAALAAEGSRHGRKRIARLMRTGGLVGARAFSGEVDTGSPQNMQQNQKPGAAADRSVIGCCSSPCGQLPKP
nr:IS3 family transposase [Methylobacterium crusticola]